MIGTMIEAVIACSIQIRLILLFCSKGLLLAEEGGGAEEDSGRAPRFTRPVWLLCSDCSLDSGEYLTHHTTTQHTIVQRNAALSSTAGGADRYT